jgi:hypothetical protein
MSGTEKRHLASASASICVVFPRFFVQLPKIARPVAQQLFQNRHNGLFDILRDFATQ